MTTQRVTATGTQGRIQALLADGWSYAGLAVETGLDSETIRRVQYRQRVNRTTALAVYGVYLVRCGSWPVVSWDDDDTDKPIPAFTGPPSVARGYRFAGHVVEDLDDIAEQMGFVRDRSKAGWPPRARRHVAARLGMSVVSFDRAVYRGRDYQQRSAA